MYGTICAMLTKIKVNVPTKICRENYMCYTNKTVDGVEIEMMPNDVVSELKRYAVSS